MKKISRLILGAIVLIPLLVSAKVEYKSSDEELPVITIPLTIPELIEKYAGEYGVSKEGVPLNKIMPLICDAESDCSNIPNWKYTDENGHYTAYGIFQITRSTWRDYCGDDVSGRMIPEENIECAMKIAVESGLHHWKESESNWR